MSKRVIMSLSYIHGLMAQNIYYHRLNQQHAGPTLEKRFRSEGQNFTALKQADFFWIVCACKVDQTIIQRLLHRGCNFKSGVASDVRPDTQLVTLQLGYYCFHKTRVWNSALAELMMHRSSRQMARAGVAPSSARAAPCPRNSRLSFNALASRTRSASLSVRKSLPGGRTHRAASPLCC